MVCPQNHSHRAFLLPAYINLRQWCSWKGLYWSLAHEDVWQATDLYRDCLYKSVPTSGGSFRRREAASLWLSRGVSHSPSKNREPCLNKQSYQPTVLFDSAYFRVSLWLSESQYFVCLFIIILCFGNLVQKAIQILSWEVNKQQEAIWSIMKHQEVSKSIRRWQ